MEYGARVGAEREKVFRGGPMFTPYSHSALRGPNRPENRNWLRATDAKSHAAPNDSVELAVRYGHMLSEPHLISNSNRPNRPLVPLTRITRPRDLSTRRGSFTDPDARGGIDGSVISGLPRSPDHNP
jgi:hypothetical protein